MRYFNHQFLLLQSELSAGLMEVKLSCLVEQGSLDEAGELLEGNTVLSSPQLQAWAGQLAYHKGDMATAQQRLVKVVFCPDCPANAIQMG